MDEVHEPDPPQTDELRAQWANGSLMVRWGHETRHRLVMEFIKEHGLYGALNTFLKKNIR